MNSWRFSCQRMRNGGGSGRRATRSLPRRRRRPHVGWAPDDERRPVAVKPDVFHREGRGDQTGQLFGLRNEFFRSNGAHGRGGRVFGGGPGAQVKNAGGGGLTGGSPVSSGGGLPPPPCAITREFY